MHLPLPPALRQLLVRGSVLFSLAWFGPAGRAEVMVVIKPSVLEAPWGAGGTFTAELRDSERPEVALPGGNWIWTFTGRDGKDHRSAHGSFPLVALPGEKASHPAWEPGEVITVSAWLPGSECRGEAKLRILGELVVPHWPEELETKATKGGGGSLEAGYATPPRTAALAQRSMAPSALATARTHVRNRSPHFMERYRSEAPSSPAEATGSGSSSSTSSASPLPPESSSCSSPPSRSSTRTVLPPGPAALPMPGSQRRYPPASTTDGPKRMKTAGRTNLFEDAEILWDRVPEGPVRAVLLQEGRKTCGPSVLVMRLEDLGLATRSAFKDYLKDSRLRNVTDLVAKLGAVAPEARTEIVRIPGAGRDETRETAYPRVIQVLSVGIKEHGPVIASISDSALGGHWLIVDSIHLGEDKGMTGQSFAWIRDPYHGWSIPVTLDALASRLVDEGDPQTLLHIFLDPPVPASLPES